LKKAFTLIELLVVIAIIAILAAILFPVFAQAKVAAKLTANLSNNKNLGLAVIMYTNDADDSFPLAQAVNLNDNAFFGLDPWQVTTQPYIKNWGIFSHPLGPSIPSSPPSIQAWRQALMYGAMAKAENGGGTTYQASTGLGSFARRVCNSTPCQYEGLFGEGCNDGLGDICFYPGNNRTVSSYTTTGVGNPANALLVTDGAMWDLWSQVIPGPAANPCTYGVYWSPGQYDILGVSGSYSMACPAARKIPRAQSAPTGAQGACTPSNICDGILNFGIQNGFSTYVATDGHAVSQDYRGGPMKVITLSDGVTTVLQGMWPAGY